MTTIEFADLHLAALDDATNLVETVGLADLERDTPCAAWDLRALLQHMIGQNHGIAVALRNGDAPKSAFDPRSFDHAELVALWADSTAAVSASVEQADPATTVRLVEFAPTLPLPVMMVAGMHLVDTVVHAWDVAASLGRTYRPAGALFDRIVRSVSDLPVETVQAMPDPVFAAPLPTSDSDGWVRALARLGRRATAAGAWDR